MPDKTIEELIVQCQTDCLALEQLYLRMKKPVIALAFGLLQDASLAEDCLQETFVRLPTAALKFKKNAYGQAFILSITRNVSKELLRRHKNQKHQGELSDCIPATRFEIEEVIQVRDLLKQLSEKQRELVILHIYLGYSFAEIAAIQCVPASTVRSRYAKTLKILRNEWGISNAAKSTRA